MRNVKNNHVNHKLIGNRRKKLFWSRARENLFISPLVIQLFCGRAWVRRSLCGVTISTTSRSGLGASWKISELTEEEEEQGRIHGQYQLRTGGQGRKSRKCVFSHFPTRSSRTDGRTDGRTDKASYRVACPQLKRKNDIS